MRFLLRRIASIPFFPLRFLPPTIVARAAGICMRLTANAAPARWATVFALHIRSATDAMVSTQATRLEGGVHPKHRLIGYHRFFVERIHPGERVLDIGSGVGALAYAMAKDGGATVTGIELSEKNHRLAVERFSHPRVQYIHGDIFKDLPDGRVDVAVMSNVLEHIDDRVGFLRSVDRRLRPKRWLLRIPRYDREWMVPLMDELGVDSRLDTTHFTEYTPESFSTEMRDAGLRITHLESRWGEFWCEAVPV